LKTNYNIIYTATDIKKYLDGELSPIQMHEIEKAALDDEFLADAIEGYATKKNEENDLVAIQQRFTLAKAKVITFKPTLFYRLAAAVTIIAIAGSAIFFLSKKHPKQNEIVQIVPPSEINSPTIKADSLAIAEHPTTTTNSTKSIEASSNTIIKDLTHQHKTESSRFSNYDSAPPVVQNKIEGELVTNEAAQAPQINQNLPTNKTEPANELNKEISREESKRDNAVTNLYFAAVTNAAGEPLPFANISVTNQNFGTYADASGKFRLLSNDSILNVSVKVAGYKIINAKLFSKTVENKIVVTEEDNFRQEIVATNSNNARSSLKAKMQRDSATNIEPIDGWDKYNLYVNNNFELPDDIKTKNLHGTVEVTFDINKQGNATNIKIVNANCNNCNEAVQKLLQQGPLWKTSNNNGKAKMIFTF
jgi:hypothetical protein